MPPAAPGRNEAFPRERLHDLHEMIARDRQLLGDFRHGEAAIGRPGEPHQGAQAEVRERGEAHEKVPNISFARTG